MSLVAKPMNFSASWADGFNELLCAPPALALSERMHWLLDLGREEFGLDLAGLVHVSKHAYRLHGVIAPANSGFSLGQEIPAELTNSCQVVETGKPYAFASAGSSDQSRQAPYRNFGLEAYLGVPVWVAGRLWGVLVFCSRTPRNEQFDEHHIKRAEMLAAVAGQWLHIEEAEQRMRMIFDLIPSLIWFKDADNNILRANKAAAESIGVTVSEMEGSNTAEFYPEHAEKYHQDDLAVFNSGQAKVGIVEPYVADGVSKWIQTDKIPAINEDGHVWSLLVMATDVTNMADSRAQLVAENVELSITARVDGLTGLLNRSAWDEMIQTAHDMRVGQQQTYSVLMMDTDHFKLLNDTVGHAAGDECLRILGKSLLDHAPVGAIVGRYGGEEFGVLLPNTDVGKAAEQAEFYVREIRKLRIPHDASPTSDFVTISIGVAERVDGADVEAAVQAADAALYEAKSAGRDCVRVAAAQTV